MNTVTRNRIRRAMPVLCDRLAWTVIIIASLYITGHVVIAILRIREILAWHGY